ncbi:unnamed protein product [Chrysoparadoxa australica]
MSLKKRLDALVKREENRFCADCRAREPRWASATLGVFICLECSGIHRSLGVHITFVRSVNLDSWKPEHVANMERWGNARAKAYFEANVPEGYPVPGEHASVRERTVWIKDKYERKRFIADECPPAPAAAAAAAPSEETTSRRGQASSNSSGSEKERSTRSKQRSQRRGTGGSAPLQRVEGSRSKPALAPAPVIDLLDFSAPATPAALDPTSQAAAGPTAEFGEFQSASSPALMPAAPEAAAAAAGVANFADFQAAPPAAPQTAQVPQAAASGNGSSSAQGPAPQKVSNAAIMNMFHAPLASGGGGGGHAGTAQGNAVSVAMAGMGPPAQYNNHAHHHNSHMQPGPTLHLGMNSGAGMGGMGGGMPHMAQVPVQPMGMAALQQMGDVYSNMNQQQMLQMQMQRNMMQMQQMQMNGTAHMGMGVPVSPATAQNPSQGGYMGSLPSNQHGQLPGKHR